MKPKRGFLRWYLVLAVGFGILGLLDSLLTFFDVVNNIYVGVVVLLSAAFFLYNLVVIPVFHAHHIERIAYVLPIYHIITFLLFFGFGFLTKAMNLLVSWLWIVIVGAGLLSALFEIGFALYLIRRLDVFHVQASSPSSQAA